MRLPRMTTRRWMIAIAVTSVSLAAWDRVIEAYDVYRFHKGRHASDVTGVITAVNRREGLVTINIGSDDGIVVGDVLYLFREEPETRYLGKVRISAAEYDSAVGQVVARGRGLAIREGDRATHSSVSCSPPPRVQRWVDRLAAYWDGGWGYMPCSEKDSVRSSARMSGFLPSRPAAPAVNAEP
jgi:hypothetical protein